MPKIVGYTTYPHNAMGQTDPLSQIASGALAPLEKRIESIVNEKMVLGGIAMTLGFIALGALVYVRTER